MVDKPISDYKETIGRIQLVTGCRTQQELAEFFGIRQSSISDAKKRGSIPSDWLITLWRKRGINPDWILWGEGEKMIPSANESKIRVKSGMTVARSLERFSLEELLREIIRRVSKY